jgi:hypothetical protein
MHRGCITSAPRIFHAVTYLHSVDIQSRGKNFQTCLRGILFLHAEVSSAGLKLFSFFNVVKTTSIHSKNINSYIDI